MPELPEVESVRRYLAGALNGRSILEIESLFKGVFSIPSRHPSPMLPARFLEADRKGKMLILRFEEKQTLLVHLRMTGRLYFPRPEQVLLPHTHVRFRLDNDMCMAYRDTRRFGRLLWYVGKGDDAIRELVSLGPDALSISRTEFGRLLSTRNRMIKPLLLDQSILSGLGNIYVDESLFLAGIHPKQISSQLSSKRLGRLWESIREILDKAIENGGSTVRDFVGSSGESGGYQRHHAVYGRGGLECRRCGKVLRRTLIAQRGTVHCPICQTIRKPRTARHDPQTVTN